MAKIGYARVSSHGQSLDVQLEKLNSTLRATYICFRFLNGAPIYGIANNCRTSVAVIQESYARHLGAEMLRNINRQGKQLVGWDD